MLTRGCKLSMDGRGTWRDNVSVERPYLKADDSVSAARADIANDLHWYNTSRPHSSLGHVTPEQARLSLLPTLDMAA